MRNIKTFLICAITLLLLILAFADARTQIAGEEGEKQSDQENAKFKMPPPPEVIKQFGAGNIEDIHIDEAGAPRHLYGDLNKGITAATPLEKAYQLFELHKDVFGIKDPRQELIYRDERHRYGPGKVSVITFNQRANGIDVFASEYHVHFNREGEINGVNGDIFPDAYLVDTTPTISKEEAVAVAFNQPSISYYNQFPSFVESIDPDSVSSLYIIEHEGEYHLAWCVNISYAARYYIDAHDGTYIWENSNIIGGKGDPEIRKQPQDK